MQFRIADTFTDSLARLMGDEQKAVKTTAFDLQLNPTSHGLRFHKLDRAKDKNFWSVRVSADIRLIVHRTDQSLLLGYVDHHNKAALVIEGDKPPPPALVKKVAADCGVAAGDLTILFAPTGSLAGTVQIAARCLEVALHKAHELHFALDHIIDGIATAPLPPPAPDFVAAMGRTNDAIIYGGRAQLFVSSGAKEARTLAENLPSLRSKDYGKPFADIFAAVKGDFYAIDRMLFSPAMVTVTSLKTGESFQAGRIDSAVLSRSFA